MSTSVANVISHFPDAENGFSTTTAGSVASGATTVTLNSVAGYTNGLPAVFVIDPTDAAKKQTFTGIIDTSGVQITSVVWTAGTNQTHALGATVVDYATATHIAMISKGILVHADQDGTLKAGAVDGAGVLASNVVTTAKILDGNVTTAKILDSNVTTAKIADTNVTNAKLATGAGQPGGAWTSWVPTWTGLTAGNGALTYAKYTQVGKTIHLKLRFVLGTTSSVASSISFSAPVNLSADYIDSISALNATGLYRDVSASSTFVGFAIFGSASTISLANGATLTTLGPTVPFTWATGDIISVAVTYESA